MVEFVWGKLLGVHVVFVDQKSVREDSNYKEAKPYFKGEFLETFFIPREGGTLLVGVGENPRFDEPSFVKDLAATGAKTIQKMGVKRCTFFLEPFLEKGDCSILQSVALGICLALYEMPTYKTDKTPETSTQIALMGILGRDLEEAKEVVVNTATIAQAITFAREMTNRPANHLRPERLADEITRLVKQEHVHGEILTKKDLQEQGFGGILAVGGSSAYDPCLVVLRYQGDPVSKECIGLVGKGITFDSGGYSLKPSKGMETMKGDMAGAAYVAAVFYALAKNHAKVNVTAILPLAENKIGDTSVVPGDVITMYDGQTVEVLNTDAEGRLILADAVAYGVRKEKLTKVIDMATLTGACVMALGRTITGVVSNADDLWSELWKASQKTGERFWRMPYYKEHEEMLESTIADWKNIGGSDCGMMTAGLFIKNFAGDLPWMHLDIAGPSFIDTPGHAYEQKGATGVTIETLYTWLSQPKK